MFRVIIIKILTLAAVFTILLQAVAAQAAIVLSSTRIIFNAFDPVARATSLAANDQSILLTNKGKSPSLAKMWLDDGRQGVDPSVLNVPFEIVPPIARIDPGQSQSVRLVYTGSANQLPQDRESVYYFNVLDVPPVDKSLANKHYVRFVFNTRIKLFYRPAHLLGTLGEAEKNLRWMLVKQKNGTALKAVNASPYYVSFSKIVLKQHDKIYNTQQQGGMVAPRSAQLFPLVNGQRVTQGGTVEYMAINDYGGNVPLNASLSAPLTGVAGT